MTHTHDALFGYFLLRRKPGDTISPYFVFSVTLFLHAAGINITTSKWIGVRFLEGNFPDENIDANKGERCKF